MPVLSLFFNAVGVSILTGLVALTSSAAQEVSEPASASRHALPAPYQLHSVERRAATTLYSDDAALGQKAIVIDLGSAEDRAAPAYEDFPVWTIIGERGWSKALKIDIEKRCEYLCGDEYESCFYVAIVALSDPEADIGAPLAAIEGVFELEDYVILTPEPLEGTPLAISENFSGLFPKEDYRVSSHSDNAATIAIRWPTDSGAYTVDVEAADCTAHRYEALGLENTTCNSISILSRSGTPLIVSQADYNLSKTTPVAAFAYGGARHYVIRYGAKAQDIIGVITAAPGSWRGLFRGRDRALLC